MANQFARTLRNNATPAERILWQQLRLLKPEGRHFRRQVPVGRFVADFACHDPKLVIELDGGQHAAAAAYDAARSEVMTSQGYRVIRFWNGDIYNDLEGVVDRIRHEARLPSSFTYAHLRESQTPTPALPTRGRE
ncbi:MAG: DUF559 domain-containing protein [Proteobacteria bacterium]|nr:DUF559 domain-containing protein [Pseudomonadota bacterium]